MKKAVQALFVGAWELFFFFFEDVCAVSCSPLFRFCSSSSHLTLCVCVCGMCVCVGVIGSAADLNMLLFNVKLTHSLTSEAKQQRDVKRCVGAVPIRCYCLMQDGKLRLPSNYSS